MTRTTTVREILTKNAIGFFVTLTTLGFALVCCGVADEESKMETESSVSAEAPPSPTLQPESTTATKSTVVITNDGLTPEGSPQITVSTNVAIDLIVGSPETDSEPVRQEPGTQSYPLYPAPALGESLTWVVVALDPDTQEVLGEETFTWTREE